MPLTHRDAPKGGTAAVRSALKHFAGLPEAHLHALAGTTPAELVPSVPHQVFNVGLTDLAAKRGLAATQPTGWRYLLHQADETVASAETVVIDGKERFSHFNQGPFVESTKAALKLAERLPQTKKHTYEPRLFHVPALYTVALWLHGDGKNDLLIPLDPAPTGIEPNHPYPADELLRILAEKAKQIPHLEPDDTRVG